MAGPICRLAIAIPAEKWAILTYCNHKAVIHEKKGGDKGIDGITYIITADGDTDKMVLQVKSGNVGRGDIAPHRRWRRLDGLLLTRRGRSPGAVSSTRAPPRIAR